MNYVDFLFVPCLFLVFAIFWFYWFSGARHHTRQDNSTMCTAAQPVRPKTKNNKKTQNDQTNIKEQRRVLMQISCEKHNRERVGFTKDTRSRNVDGRDGSIILFHCGSIFEPFFTIAPKMLLF